MTMQIHWDSWPTQFIKIKIYIQIKINPALIPSSKIRKNSLTPSSNKFSPNAAPKPMPVSTKTISGSAKMISWDPSMDLQSLNKSKPPNYHLRKPEKSRKDEQSLNQNPRKSRKSANQNKPYKKGSNSSTNCAARPKTFQKIMVRPLSDLFSNITIR